MRGRVTTVSVSAESGVQRVVDEIVKKKLDLARIDAAAENAHKAVILGTFLGREHRGYLQVSAS